LSTSRFNPFTFSRVTTEIHRPNMCMQETERERRLRLRKEEMASRSAQPPPSFTAAVEPAAPRTARGAGNPEPRAAAPVEQHFGELRHEPGLIFMLLIKGSPREDFGQPYVIPRWLQMTRRPGRSQRRSPPPPRRRDALPKPAVSPCIISRDVASRARTVGDAQPGSVRISFQIPARALSRAIPLFRAARRWRRRRREH
jgi:hypothetical protein